MNRPSVCLQERHVITGFDVRGDLHAEAGIGRELLDHVNAGIRSADQQAASHADTLTTQVA